MTPGTLPITVYRNVPFVEPIRFVGYNFTGGTFALQVRTLPGGEFLWLLLKHVLPRRFRRVRDFGLLHANAKRLIQLLQLTLHMRVPSPEQVAPRPPVLCDRCGEVMTILARMVEPSHHRLC
jgi:hypothetical protein